ncbi:MAG: alpha/beta hydrolase [Acinetobacter sp.]|nr:MAG: alpha/beta hydrolase [Acinetobacter sp.]
MKHYAIQFPRKYFFLILTFAVITFSSSVQGQVNWAIDEHISPKVKDFLKILNNGSPGLETLSPKAAQQVLVDAQKAFKTDMSGVTISEKVIKSDGFSIKLNIVRPAGAKGILPVFIFIHGGGWILGDFPTHMRMVRDLSVLSGFQGVFVNYTRTPEAVFPQQINEVYAAIKWVAANGAQIKADGKNMAVVGNSVGGNMTAVTSIMAKEKNGPKIKLQIMMWPIVDCDFETASYKLYGQDRFLTVPTMKWMYDMYIPDPKKRLDIHASPLRATKEQLKGLPPALIQIAENDVLRDEGEAYGRALEQAGVSVTTVRYNGMIHDFGLLNGLAYIPQTRSLFIQAAAEMKKRLK